MYVLSIYLAISMHLDNAASPRHNVVVLNTLHSMGFINGNWFVFKYYENIATRSYLPRESDREIINSDFISDRTLKMMVDTFRPGPTFTPWKYYIYFVADGGLIENLQVDSISIYQAL